MARASITRRAHKSIAGATRSCGAPAPLRSTVEGWLGGLLALERDDLGRALFGPLAQDLEGLLAGLLRDLGDLGGKRHRLLLRTGHVVELGLHPDLRVLGAEHGLHGGDAF